MRRQVVAGAVVWGLLGCQQTFIVAEGDLESASGGESQTGSAESGETEPFGSETSNTSAVPSCDEPLPVAPEDCDAFADPLRAPEIACLPGVAAQTFESSDGSAWRSTREFGNAFWVADSGSAVLALSTTALPEANAAGQVALEPGSAEFSDVDNDNPETSELPGGISVNPGSNGGNGGTPFFGCDGIGDCSETLPAVWSGEARDLIWFSFDIEVPMGARVLEVDLAWLTAEFPERVGVSDADVFVLWVEGAEFTGNIATFGGQALTTSGVASLLSEFQGEHPSLVRTGFDGTTAEACTIAGEVVSACPVGAATGWLTAAAPVEPGEVISVVAALFEQGPVGQESAVLLDGFRWGCTPCTPGSDCGVRVRD